jgi:hypothetical protein
MSKEYKLDILKNNKSYNDTFLSLWSGKATYQEYLATAMLIMGYDLRQNIDDLTMMDIGQISAGTNKVIQLHGRAKSLILWYTNGDIIPIVAKFEEGNLLFSIYNHENTYLKGYIDGLSTKDLYGASEEVFEKLMELATSQDSPLSDKIEGDWAYTLRNVNMGSDLVEIMNDPQNMTTDIAQSLTDIYELLKSDSNKEINLPSGAPEDVKGFMLVEHYLPKLSYSEGSSSYHQYKSFIVSSVRSENTRYSDGTRIAISKDFKEVKVYDDKGLSYPVTIMQNGKDFESCGIVEAENKFLKDLDFLIEIAKRSNKLYAELGDLKGAEFTEAEVIWGRVNLHFKKTNWNTNKVVEGTILFKSDYTDYTITFKSRVKGVSQKLKLSDEEVLILPSSPLEYTKTVHTNGKDVAQAFHVSLYYVESAKLADLLEFNGLLVQDKKD